MRPSRFDLVASLGGLALCWLGWGCAGELDSPERFRETPGSAGASGSGGSAGEGGSSGSSAGPCDAPKTILNDRCAASCHSAASKLGGLDLESADLVGRLRGKMGTICSSVALIDPDAPEKSALYDKTAAQPSCGGSSMPQGGEPLSEQERACLLEWITAAVAP